MADALASRASLQQQLLASTALLDAENERARLTQLRLEHGAASQLEWLDAQRAQFAAQQALVLTRLAYLQNQVALFKALGGGVSGPKPAVAASSGAWSPGTIAAFRLAQAVANIPPWL